jgi:Mg2+/Co2+ transporter CorC
MGAMGRVPEVGERVELDGVVFTAESVQGRRIQKIHIAIEDTGAAENLDAR